MQSYLDCAVIKTNKTPSKQRNKNKQLFIADNIFSILNEMQILFYTGNYQNKHG